MGSSQNLQHGTHEIPLNLHAAPKKCTPSVASLYALYTQALVWEEGNSFTSSRVNPGTRPGNTSEWSTA